MNHFHYRKFYKYEIIVSKIKTKIQIEANHIMLTQDQENEFDLLKNLLSYFWFPLRENNSNHFWQYFLSRRCILRREIRHKTIPYYKWTLISIRFQQQPDRYIQLCQRWCQKYSCLIMIYAFFTLHSAFLTTMLIVACRNILIFLTQSCMLIFPEI